MHTNHKPSLFWPSVLWHYWSGVRKSIQPKKLVVIGLVQGADLHMAQLMPLPLSVSCFSKIQIGSGTDSPGFFKQDFAWVARPLHNLTRKKVPFQWDDDCEVAFLELKKWLISTLILIAPCDEGTYVLDTDISNTALGAVFQQEQDGQLHVIAYVSHALLHAERQCCITRKKLLGVVYGLKKYHSICWDDP